MVDPRRPGAAIQMSIRHPNGTIWRRNVTSTSSGGCADRGGLQVRSLTGERRVGPPEREREIRCRRGRPRCSASASIGSCYHLPSPAPSAGSSFVSCTSFSVRAKYLNPALPGDNGCDPITYNVSVTFLTETYQVGPVGHPIPPHPRPPPQGRGSTGSAPYLLCLSVTCLAGDGAAE